MSRRHAFHKMVSIVQGTNLVRRELGLPEAAGLAADPRYSLVEERLAAHSAATLAASRRNAIS